MEWKLADAKNRFSEVVNLCDLRKGRNGFAAAMTPSWWSRPRSLSGFPAFVRASRLISPRVNRSMVSPSSVTRAPAGTSRYEGTA